MRAGGSLCWRQRQCPGPHAATWHRRQRGARGACRTWGAAVCRASSSTSGSRGRPRTRPPGWWASRLTPQCAASPPSAPAARSGLAFWPILATRRQPLTRIPVLQRTSCRFVCARLPSGTCVWTDYSTVLACPLSMLTNTHCCLVEGQAEEQVKETSQVRPQQGFSFW